MSNLFPIVTVEPAHVNGQEAMGGKRKFWCCLPDRPNHWLFKFPRPGTGEHWAEKVAAEVAGQFKIPHPPVELAIFQNQRGTITESFLTDRGRERKTIGLVHGNEVLAGRILGYDQKQQFHQSQHTLDNILLALERTFTGDVVAIQRQMAEYLVFDAIIGNTDRHHENWALLRWQKEEKWYGALAPTYDHATSLGRELTAERRTELLVQKRIGWYSERGHGAIFAAETDKRGICPLGIARLGMLKYSSVFRPALERFFGESTLNLEGVMVRIPEEWMSVSEKAFALGLMNYNLSELRKLLV